MSSEGVQIGLKNRMIFFFQRLALRESNISRYEAEFAEICTIGFGQFGSVHKCINRLGKWLSCTCHELAPGVDPWGNQEDISGHTRGWDWLFTPMQGGGGGGGRRDNFRISKLGWEILQDCWIMEDKHMDVMGIISYDLGKLSGKITPAWGKLCCMHFVIRLVEANQCLGWSLWWVLLQWRLNALSCPSDGCVYALKRSLKPVAGSIDE